MGSIPYGSFQGQVRLDNQESLAQQYQGGYQGQGQYEQNQGYQGQGQQYQGQPQEQYNQAQPAYYGQQQQQLNAPLLQPMPIVQNRNRQIALRVVVFVVFFILGFVVTSLIIS